MWEALVLRPQTPAALPASSSSPGNHQNHRHIEVLEMSHLEAASVGVWGGGAHGVTLPLLARDTRLAWAGATFTMFKHRSCSWELNAMCLFPS